MQAPQSVNNLCGVNFRSLFTELLIFPQVSEQFSTIQEINDEVKFCLSLESIMQSYNIRIFDFL